MPGQLLAVSENGALSLFADLAMAIVRCFERDAQTGAADTGNAHLGRGVAHCDRLHQPQASDVADHPL